MGAAAAGASWIGELAGPADGPGVGAGADCEQAVSPTPAVRASEVMARLIPERFMAVPFVEERYAFTIRPLDSAKKPPKVSLTVTPAPRLVAGTHEP